MRKNSNFIRKTITIIMTLLMTLSVFLPSKVGAEPPYDTFSVNGFGQTIFSQPAYEPTDVFAQDIYVENEEGELEYSPLSQPQDLFIDHNDEIYIVDTGNNRIVHLDENGELIRILDVPEDPLNQPAGIFVNDNDHIYVADTGNRRVLHLNENGEVLQEFSRPESPYIDDSFVYEPINMIVDSRGFVYVVSRGTYQGIIQFSPEAEFYGFFGTNITEVTVMDVVRTIFYTEEQRRRQVRLLPNPIVSIAVDEKGYIYTISNDRVEQIKKLNIRGENQWEDFAFQEHVNFGFLSRIRDLSIEEAGAAVQLSDITVDKNGIVTVADKQSSYIAQFNQDGEILFFWGTHSTTGSPQRGILHSPVSIDTNSKNQIFVLDDSLNLVQVLNPTEFGAAVHEAFVLMDEGFYDESYEYWEEVSRQNALFTPAYVGLARAEFYNENYRKAQELYKRAGDEEGYSDSFWQIRLQWFQERFPLFANIFLITLVLIIVYAQVRSRIRKRKGIRRETRRTEYEERDSSLLGQLQHAFYTLRHPIDGFDDMRFRNMGGYLSSFIILLLVIALALTRIYFTSFTFQPIQIGNINVGAILLTAAAAWISWVVCHYLIGTIQHGQARFRDVVIGSSYSMFPIFILGLPLAFLSNIMTINEASIYNSINAFMIIWCAMLLFWMVMTLQNYTVGETVVSILLTLFSMVILWVLIFIVVGLSSETIDFITTLYREVTM